MPRPCRVCTGRYAADIERDLRGGLSQQQVADHYGYTIANVKTHIKHLKEDRARAEKFAEMKSKAELGDQIREQNKRLLNAISRAEKADNFQMQIRFETELGRNMTLQQKVESESNSSDDNLQHDIIGQISPVISIILNSLTEHPNLKKRLLNDLQSLIPDIENWNHKQPDSPKN